MLRIWRKRPIRMNCWETSDLLESSVILLEPALSIRHCLQTQILIQFEAQQGLGWNLYLFTFGQHLSASASGGANSCANRCPLTASHDRADQCSQRGTTTHHDCRLFVRTHSLPTLPFQIAGANQVPGSRHGHRIHVKNQIGSRSDAAARCAADYQLCV